MHFGSLKINPSLTVERYYTDNFFPRDYIIVQQEPGKEPIIKKIKTSKWTTTITPSLYFSLPLGRNSVDLGYTFRHYSVQDLSEFTTKNHEISSTSKWYFISGFNLAMADTVHFGEGIGYHATDIIRNYTDNRISITGSYELTQRFSTKVGFEDYMIRFKQDVFKPDNTDRTMINASLLYQIMPKTFIGIEYSRERTDRQGTPARNTDHTTQDYGVTIQLEDPDGRLSGELRAGTEKLTYDDKSLNQMNNLFGFTADLTFKKSNYTTITFSGSRYQASTGITTEDAQYGASFTTTSFTLGLTHKFTYKISGTVNYAYVFTTYNTQGAISSTPINISRTDTVKRGGVELNYQIREWLGFAVKCYYTQDDSNLPQESYIKKDIMTTIIFRF